MSSPFGHPPIARVRAYRTQSPSSRQSDPLQREASQQLANGAREFGCRHVPRNKKITNKIGMDTPSKHNKM